MRTHCTRCALGLEPPTFFLSFRTTAVQEEEVAGCQAYMLFFTQAQYTDA